MFGKEHYVPFLKWKRGEYRAIQQLDPTQKSKLTPMFDLPLLDYDPPNGSIVDPAFDSALMKLIDQVEKFWGPSGAAFFDFGVIEPTALYSGVANPAAHFFDVCALKGIIAIPVTGLGRDPSYQSACFGAAKRHKTGLALRLGSDELVAQNLDLILGQFVASAQLNYTDCDLIIDLGITPSQPAFAVTTLRLMLSALSSLHQWRTVTVASGSYPQTMSTFPVGNHRIPRSDRDLWLALLQSGISRIPTFGDYTTTHPIASVLPPAAINVSVSLRYTISQEWFLMRGQGNLTANSGGNAQFVSHARSLIQMPIYKGSTFSSGDNAIDLIAQGTTPPGNPEVWLRIAINHHLAHVVDALATTGAP